MSTLPTRPRRGDDILSHVIRMWDFIRKERIVSVVGGGILKQTDGGKSIEIPIRGEPSTVLTPGDDPRGAAIDSVIPDTTTGYYLKSYSFETWKTSDTTIEMEPGDIWLGPATVIHWTDISGYDTTPAVTSTDTCLWLEINVDAETALLAPPGTRNEMENGDSHLDASELLNTMIVPLVETTWAGGVITAVKNLQCGDVKISRAAG